MSKSEIKRLVALGRPEVAMQEIERLEAEIRSLKKCSDVARWDEALSENKTLHEENERLRKGLGASVKALRSYQYGNSATDLAKDIADFGETALEGKP